MFVSQSRQLTNGKVIKFSIEKDASPVSYADVIHLWQRDADFRAFFGDLLKKSPFAAFRWETPPVTTLTADQPFEFVLLDSPDIARDPDPEAFDAYFASRRPGGVVEFSNLGGDAVLVVPCPDYSASGFGHLAAYLRNSRERQQHLLWQSVGAAMQRRMSTEPVWLSTAGGGVAWLHVRLDDRPKYYAYAPYRSAA